MKNKKKVNIWLPINEWDNNSRSDFEKIICKLLNICDSKNKFFDWNIIKEEDWLTSWKKYWAPELVGNHFLILPCWINPNEKFKDKKIIKIDPGAAFGTGSHPEFGLKGCVLTEVRSLCYAANPRLRVILAHHLLQSV